MNNVLTQSDRKPIFYILDNEVSADLKGSLTKQKIAFQLIPPHVHRCNTAERATRTSKNHFLAGLAYLDPTFPIEEWDRLLPRCSTTLNLLRNARAYPKLSSYAYLFGNFNFNFNKTPTAPPGIRVAVHKKPTNRKS